MSKPSPRNCIATDGEPEIPELVVHQGVIDRVVEVTGSTILGGYALVTEASNERVDEDADG